LLLQRNIAARRRDAATRRAHATGGRSAARARLCCGRNAIPTGERRMAIWNCTSCGEDNDSDFGICWNCGAELEGGTTSLDFAADAPDPAVDDDGPVERALQCPRCGTPMQGFGRVRFHESSSTRPVIYGALGGLLVNRNAFDAYACSAPDCGKVELFTITLAEIAREE
jgi:hypothetical protein